MILRSLNNNIRTAALVGAAVVTLAAASAQTAHAQALANLFGGTPQSNTGANVAALFALGGPLTNTQTLGAGYTGTVTLPAGLVANITETVNGTGSSSLANPGALVITTTGVTAGATFTATKNFGDASALLLPNTQYQFAVSRSSGTTVSLLGNLGFTLSLNSTPFVNSATGTGVLGGLAVNVANLLSDNGSANFVFTTPAVIPAGATLNFATNGTLGAGAALGTSSLVLSAASITQVPEPGTVAATLVGMVALAAWRTRRVGRTV